MNLFEKKFLIRDDFGVKKNPLFELFPFGNNIKTKIILSDGEGYWFLKPGKNKRHPSVLDEHYIQYSDETGVYCFFVLHEDKFYPIYIGSGCLSDRIRKKYHEIRFGPWSEDHLYISFEKYDNLNTEKKLVDLEIEQIKTLCPALNNTHNDLSSNLFNLNNSMYRKVKDKANKHV